jgi:hypothetical protein
MNINEGDHSAIYLTDFNSDGELDMFLGQVGGGVSFYSSDTSLVDLNELILPEMRVYPIPAKNTLVVETGGPVNTTWSVIDISGRIVMQGYLNGSRLELNISKLPAGAYFIRLDSDIYKPARFLVE